jgi:DNA-binding transcriptional LysR family regulator
MDSDGLATFLAVHRLGAITRAATAMHLSQPAMSRRLTTLERELGVPLFERVTNGMTLTDAGRALLPYAESVVAGLEDAAAAVEAVRSDPAGPVSLALVGTLAGTHLTEILKGFARRQPRIRVNLRTATSREVSDLVRRADVTLGLRYAADPDPHLTYEHLYDERLVLVGPPDHPPRRRLRDLGREQWLAFPQVAGRPEAAGRAVHQVLDAAAVPDDQILQVDSLTAQKRLVEAGFGIALVPESAVGEELLAGTLRIVEVTGLDVGVPVTLVTRRGGYMSAAAAALVEEIRLAG